MDLSILQTELQQANYSAMTDPQIADSLNAKTIPSKKPIPVIDIEKYLASTRKYIPIIDSADINAREAVLALSKFSSFDTTNPTYLGVLTGILDGLVTAGLLIAADKTAILALADIKQSWSEQNWLGDVTLADIANAREYI